MNKGRAVMVLLSTMVFDAGMRWARGFLFGLFLVFLGFFWGGEG